MRLFIAVNFSENVKSKLTSIQNTLKQNHLKGSYTRKENLHLTLAFIGEVENSRVESVKQAMNTVGANAFSITISGLGRFNRTGGDIWWIGVKQNDSLNEIHKSLCASLAAKGFKLTEKGFESEGRRFTPHLTLVRRAWFEEETKEVVCDDLIEMPVKKISLMKSEQINGILTYTEIHATSLT